MYELPVDEAELLVRECNEVGAVVADDAAADGGTVFIGSSAN